MLSFVGACVLLMIDFQKEGYEAGSGIPLMEGYAETVRRARRVVAAARSAGIPIIFVQEVHRPGGIDIGRELDGSETMHCIEGAPGTVLVDGLQPRGEREHLVTKRRYSAFLGTELDWLLRAHRAETLIIAGCLTDVCVHYTAADAHQRDYHIRVIADCVIGSSIPAHDASLVAMRYLQRDAIVSSDEIIDALTERTAAAR